MRHWAEPIPIHCRRPSLSTQHTPSHRIALHPSIHPPTGALPSILVLAPLPSIALARLGLACCFHRLPSVQYLHLGGIDPASELLRFPVTAIAPRAGFPVPPPTVSKVRPAACPASVGHVPARPWFLLPRAAWVSATVPVTLAGMMRAPLLASAAFLVDLRSLPLPG